MKNFKTAEPINTSNREPYQNDKRPISRFYRSWLEDVTRGVSLQQRRGVNHEQFRAADRLICGYERAFATGGAGGGLGFAKIIPKKSCFKSFQIDRQVQAMHDHKRVFSQLSRKSQEIIEHFCLLELPLRKFEMKQIPQWPKGVGSARLREALDDLIEIYRKCNCK